MYGLFIRGCLLWVPLAIAGTGLLDVEGGSLPQTRPSAAGNDPLMISQFPGPERPLTVLETGAAPFALPDDTAANANRPATPVIQSVYDPLPPALWSALSMLLLAGLLLSLRRVRSYLR